MATQNRVELTGGNPDRRHILVLDGGGVRGLSSLVILDRLLSRVEEHVQLHRGSNGTPSLKPHNIFQLIIGTSTGGLISLMIGKLGMSVHECIDEYKRLARIIFKESRHLRGRISFGVWRERYSETVLSREITALIERRGRKASELMNNKEYAYATVVCNNHEDFANGSHKLREVFICSDPCDGIRCTIGDAGRATTAAPTYFKAQKVTRYTSTGPEDIYLIDGGLGHNNPSVAAWFHYDRDTKHSELGWRGSRVVNIGTGTYDGKTNEPPKRTLLQKWIHVPSVIQLMKEVLTDSNQAVERMKLLSVTDKFDYHRFSATTGICWIKMDDHEKLDKIMSKTEEYLKIDAVNKEINSCAIRIARDYIKRLDTGNGDGPVDD